jgi:hypothetical protein
MNNHPEAASVAAKPVSTTRWNEGMFTAGFLTAAAVATIGWLIGFGWAAISLANWLFL